MSSKITKLEQFLSATLLQSKVADLVLLGGKSPLSIQEIFELSFHSDQVLGFRAGWLLEAIAEFDAERFTPILPQLLSSLAVQKNLSCQRHFSKILLIMIHPKAPSSYRAALQSVDREPIVETLFSWLIDPQTPVAVLANCMDVLYYFSKEFDWIQKELSLQIEFLMEQRNSPALFSRGKRVLKKLLK